MSAAYTDADRLVAAQLAADYGRAKPSGRDLALAREVRRLREAFPLVADQLAADEVPATIHGKPVRVVLIENDAPANVRLERDGRTWAWVEATGRAVAAPYREAPRC